MVVLSEECRFWPLGRTVSVEVSLWRSLHQSFAAWSAVKDPASGPKMWMWHNQGRWCGCRHSDMLMPRGGRPSWLICKWGKTCLLGGMVSGSAPSELSSNPTWGRRPLTVDNPCGRIWVAELLDKSPWVNGQSRPTPNWWQTDSFRWTKGINDHAQKENGGSHRPCSQGPARDQDSIAHTKGQTSTTLTHIMCWEESCSWPVATLWDTSPEKLWSTTYRKIANKSEDLGKGSTRGQSCCGECQGNPGVLGVTLGNWSACPTILGTMPCSAIGVQSGYHIVLHEQLDEHFAQHWPRWKDIRVHACPREGHGIYFMGPQVRIWTDIHWKPCSQLCSH